MGHNIKEFRANLLKETPPKTLHDLIKQITPPKGIRRKNNIEVRNIFDKYYTKLHKISINHNHY